MQNRRRRATSLGQARWPDSPGMASRIPEQRSMDASDLMAKLDKIRFFEGYTPEAEKKARARVLKQYKEGLAGEYQKYFERFPGFALCFLDVDMELDGVEDLRLVLKEYAADTF